MYNIAIIRPFGKNVGNLAINFAIRELLNEAFGRLVSIIEYPATSKYDSNGPSGLLPSSVHEINRIADGVIVGGGNLYENSELDIDHRALNALEPPLFCFSNSRGRIYNRKYMLRDRSDAMTDGDLLAISESASMNLSRDSATVNYLRSLGIPSRLGLCPTTHLGRWRDKLPSLPENEEVGALISIRTPKLMNVPADIQQSIQSQILHIRDSLRDRGQKRIRLLCNDSRDIDFAASFRDSHGIDTIYASDVYQYLRLLSDAEVLVSYRLHGTIPALSYGSNVISLVYDERAASLFNDLGIREGEEYLNIVENRGNFKRELEALMDKNISKHHQAGYWRWDSVYEMHRKVFAEFKDKVDSFRLSNA